MANTNFVTQFYNLEGEQVSEKKKNLFMLLRAQPTQLNDDTFNGLNPRTSLERLFLIDVLIYFKQFSNLLEVIKEGNELFINKILKHRMILKEIIGDIVAENFVNDFLPCTSFATRMKILKKVSFFTDEFQMDGIAYAVEERYGPHIVAQIIHTCSSEKIKKFLLKNEVTLKPKQVRFLFEKDSDLFVIYLQRQKTLTGAAFQHKNISRWVALKNPKLWLELLENDMISMTKLGRKTSRYFIRHISTNLFENAEKYMRFLKHDILVRNLQNKFPLVYFKLFPKNINNLHAQMNCQKLLKYYPKKKQWHLFEQAFKTTFKLEVMDNLTFLDTEFIQTFASKSVLNKWGEAHYNVDFNNNFLIYCDSSKVLSLVKDKIDNTTDYRERFKLTKILLENCAKHKDLLALDEFLRYVSSQMFLQENAMTMVDILKDIPSFFKLEDMNKNHWTSLNEIIQFLKSKFQLSYSNSQLFALQYMKFLMSHGKPYKKELINFIKNMNSQEFYLTIEIDTSDLEFSRKILIEMIKIYPEATQSEKPLDKWQNLVINLVYFSENHPEYAIDLSIHPWIQTQVKSVINQELRGMDYSAKNILRCVIEYNLKFPSHPMVSIEEDKILEAFRYDRHEFSCLNTMDSIVKKKYRTKFENDVLQLFWQDLKYISQYEYRLMRILKGLYCNDPETIKNNVDRIVTIYPKFLLWCQVRISIWKLLLLALIAWGKCVNLLKKICK